MSRTLHHDFTAILESDGPWHIAWCAEIPGANGQGRTREEARDSLAEAIVLIREDRREDALRELPEDAERGGDPVRRRGDPRPR